MKDNKKKSKKSPYIIYEPFRSRKKERNYPQPNSLPNNNNNHDETDKAFNFTRLFFNEFSRISICRFLSEEIFLIGFFFYFDGFGG
jgi:hypothetical protein